MGPFELQLRAFAEKAKDNADQVTRKVVLDVWARIIERSPVDTGRFRGNWTYSINAKVDQTKAVAGTSASPAPAPGAPDVEDGAFGRVHFITNSLPYAQRLETGYSNQAPLGMVGLTVTEFNAIVGNAAREVNP